MKTLKLAAIVLVLAAGLVGSYFIIKNADLRGLNADQRRQETDQIGQAQILSNSPIKWADKVRELVARKSDKSAHPSTEALGSVESNILKSETSVNSVNLTELVAKSVFGEMRILDQSESNPFDAQNFDPNSLEGQKLVEEAISNLSNSQSLFSASVDDKELKISNDNSKEAKIKYLRGIEQISINRLNSPKYFRDLEQIARDIQTDCATGGLSIHRELAQLQVDLLNDYLNLIVPRDWLSFHRDSVNYYKKANLIYSDLANCFKDPVRGSLAVQAWPQMIEEIQEIQGSLSAKWLEMGL